MSLLRRASRERRNAATLVLLLFVALALVLVFTGTLTRSTDLGAAAAEARAEVDGLDERWHIGQDEVRFLESEEFIDQVARTVGFGARNEQPFRLPADAPSPAPVVPLGSNVTASAGQAPFEAWMELLFGA